MKQVSLCSLRTRTAITSYKTVFIHTVYVLKPDNEGALDSLSLSETLFPRKRKKILQLTAELQERQGEAVTQGKRPSLLAWLARNSRETFRP